MLQAENLTVRYGPVAAVRGVSISVARGEIVAIVGPNGAGKTSVMHALTGIVRSAAGRIRFDGRDIAGWNSERIAACGLALVPEGRGIFSSLTVAENLRLGATLRGRDPAVADDLRTIGALFPVLDERSDQPAGRLSGGEQQQLAIARALMARPQLLLLDEPSLGLAPTLIERVYSTIATLRARGLTVLVVEESAARAMAAADRIYVMRNGAVVLAEAAAALRDSNALETAYFGFEPRGAA
jgi:branched-chain amino acid transport system ATP-binding protein